MSKTRQTNRVSEESRSVGERLRAMMYAYDLGLEELADLLQTQPRTLAEWVNGTKIAPACSLISLPLVSSPPQGRAYPSRSEAEKLRRVQAI